MFNISFKVGDAKLADTINRLQSINVTGVQVTKDGSIESASPASGPTTVVKVRRYVRRSRGAYKRDGVSGTDRAVSLIHSTFGVPAFRIKDAFQLAEAHGISNATVYRALNREMKAGRITKVEPGRYQRTPAAFSHSLGLDKTGT